MKNIKRLNAILLVLAMLLGMMPSMVFSVGTGASAPTATDTVLYAQYNPEALHEAEGVSLSVRLNNGVKLGATWDNRNLYLVYSGTGDVPAITAGGEAVSATKVSAVTNTVLKVSLASLGLEAVSDPQYVDLTVDGVAIKLAVVNESVTDMFSLTPTPGNISGNATPLPTIEGKNATFPYSTVNTYNSQTWQALRYTGMGEQIAADGITTVMEFDFKPTNLGSPTAFWPNPVTNAANNVKTATFMITDANKSIIRFALVNSSGKLTLVSQPPRGTGYEYLNTQVRYVSSYDVGADAPAVHMRVEYTYNTETGNYSVKYFMDGKQVLTDTFAPYAIGSEWWPLTAANTALVYTNGQAEFTVSNWTVGKTTPGVIEEDPANSNFLFAPYRTDAADLAAGIATYVNADATSKVGAIYDAEYLYLTYTGETAPAVTVDGTAVTPEAVEGAKVVKIPLTSLTLVSEGNKKMAVVTIGTWEGTLTLEKTDVVYGDEVAHGRPLSDAYYTPQAQSQAVINGNTYTFNTTEQSMGFGGGYGAIPALKGGEGTSIVEFDFNASSITNVMYWGGVQNTNGPILFYLRDDIGNKFSFAIARDHNDSQYKLVVEPQGDSIFVNLSTECGFALGKAMHVRLEIDHESGEPACVRYYINGKLILTHEDAHFAPPEDVTQPQGFMILVGKYASNFTLSNVSFGKEHMHTEATREENRVNSTCSTPGGYDLVTYCSACSEILSTERIDLPLHNYVNGRYSADHQVTPADCDSPAVYNAMCDDCDYVNLEKTVTVGTATGAHAYDQQRQGTLVATANCGSGAIYSTKCDNCDFINPDLTFVVGGPSGEHSYNLNLPSNVMATWPTATSSATYYVKCDVCTNHHATTTVSVGGNLHDTPIAGDIIIPAQKTTNATADLSKVLLNYQLVSGTRVGMIWDNQYLYLVYAGTGAAPKIYCGSKDAIAFEQDSLGSNTVLKVELADLGIAGDALGKKIFVFIDVMGAFLSFENDSPIEWSEHGYVAPHVAWIGNIPATYEGKTVTFNGKALEALHFGSAEKPLAALKGDKYASVIEFDMNISSMTSWISASGWMGGDVAAQFYVRNDRGEGLTFYFYKDTDGSIVLVSNPKQMGKVANAVDMEGLQTYADLGIGVNTTFHVRVEYTHADMYTPVAKYYVNGKLVLEDNNAVSAYQNYDEQGMVNQSFAVLTYRDQAKFALSNVTIGKSTIESELTFNPPAGPDHDTPEAGDSIVHGQKIENLQTEIPKVFLNTTLSKLSKMGVAWDDEYVYLVLSGDADAPFVTYGGNLIAVTPVTGFTNTVVKISLENLGITGNALGKKVPVTINKWVGFLSFEDDSLIEWSEHGYVDPHVAWIGNVPATYEGKTVTFNGKALEALHFGSTEKPLAALKGDKYASVIEFDMNISSMTSWISASGWMGGDVAAQFYVRNDRGDGLTFYFYKDTDGSIVLVSNPKKMAKVENAVDMEGLQTYVDLGIGVNTDFHVRVEYIHADMYTPIAKYYVNGKLVLEDNNAVSAYQNYDEQGMVNQSFAVLTYREYAKFKLSNVTIGKSAIESDLTFNPPAAPDHDTPEAGDSIVHGQKIENLQTEIPKVLLNTTLSKVAKLGVAWDDAYLYLVLNGDVDAPVVTYGGNEIPTTPIDGFTNTVVKVALADLGITGNALGKKIPVTIGTWVGFLSFENDSPIEWSEHGYVDPPIAWIGNVPATYEGKTVSFNGKALEALHFGSTDKPVAALKGDKYASVIEFDMNVSSMTSWISASGWMGGDVAAQFYVRNDRGDGLAFYFYKDTDGSIVLVSNPKQMSKVENAVDMEGLQTYVDLGIGVNTTFHVRVEYIHADMYTPIAKYYVNGKLVLVDNNAVSAYQNYDEQGMVNQSFAVLTYREHAKFKLSNVTIGKSAIESELTFTPPAAPDHDTVEIGDTVMVSQKVQDAKTAFPNVLLSYSMSKLIRMGSIWDNENLYFVLSDKVDEAVMTYNGKVITLQPIEGSLNPVVKVSWAELGITDLTKSMVIPVTVGNFSGFLNITSDALISWSEHGYLQANHWTFAQPAPEINGSAVTFNGVANQALHFGSASKPVAGLASGAGATVIEFDVTPNKMTSYANYTDSFEVSAHLQFFVKDDQNNQFTFYLSNSTKGEGLLLVSNPKQGTIEEQVYAPVGVYVGRGQTVHIRVVYRHPGGNVKPSAEYYANGVLILVDEDVTSTHTGWSSYASNFLAKNTMGVYTHSEHTGNVTISNLSIGSENSAARNPSPAGSGTLIPYVPPKDPDTSVGTPGTEDEVIPDNPPENEVIPDNPSDDEVTPEEPPVEEEPAEETPSNTVMYLILLVIGLCGIVAVVIAIVYKSKKKQQALSSEQ